jgi:hypothetical protein
LPFRLCAPDILVASLLGLIRINCGSRFMSFSRFGCLWVYRDLERKLVLLLLFKGYNLWYGLPCLSVKPLM